MSDDFETTRHKITLVNQSEASECGLACLAMVAGSLGLHIDIQILRQRFALSLKGATLKQILRISEALDLDARPIRAEMSELRELSVPAILHWEGNHFVVWGGFKRDIVGKRYVIYDPARGKRSLTEQELSEGWSGVAVELNKAAGFRAASVTQRLKLSSLWSESKGLVTTFSKIILLSLVLQIIVLLTPFYMQLAVDTALPAGDTDLLFALAIGFAGLCVINFAAEWSRSLIIAFVNNSLPYQISANLFRKMMHLPLIWFQKRHIGDIASRFSSITSLQQSLSDGFVTGLVDGAMSVMTLILMFIYSPMLSAIAVSALVIYILIRLSLFQVMKSLNVNSIAKAAVEQSAFIETLRGIETIKAFAHEGERQRVWQHKRADAAKAAMKLAQLSAGFDAGGNLLINLERVLFGLIAIELVMAGHMSVGAVFAFSAYKQQFLAAGIRLAQQISNLRMSRVHLTRIGDIALSQSEPVTLPDIVVGERIDIALRSVSFRYGMDDIPVLRDVNLRVEDGETIAIVGPSGEGKSTLLRIMMGLYEPTFGALLVNETPIGRYSPQSFRRIIGSMMQSDSLYAGSLAQNVAFFDPEMSMERVRQCLETACLLDEVEAMPLRYDTLVGDMGSALSGGQKQRLLLARALYSRPRLLFLDEGTANLDPELELRVLDKLRAVAATKIIVAHRPAVLDFADRVIRVEGGRVFSPMSSAAA